MPHLQRTSSSALISVPNTDRVNLAGVRPDSPRPLDQEWNALCRSGATPISPQAGAQHPLCHFTLSEMFGDQVSIICRERQEPSDAAMALLWRFAGACPIAMVSQTRPAHMLEYIPADYQFQYAPRPIPASAQFLIMPSTMDLRGAARHASKNGSIVIVGTDDRQTAQYVSLLAKLRSDLNLHGCTAALPGGAQQIHPAAIGTDAFDRIVNLRTGGSSFMAGILNSRDAAWINQVSGTTVKAGDVIFAPFAAQGIDRSLFARWSAEMPKEVQQRLDETVRTDIDLLPLALVYPPAPNNQTELRNLRDAIRKLGPTVVFGATGNIGSAIVETLGGKVPVTAISRQGYSDKLSGLSSPHHDVRQTNGLQGEEDIRTVFMTASLPWPICGITKRSVFDRAALLQDNLQNVLIPQLRQLPQHVELVQIITNPSSDLTYAAWLLRPDLATAFSAHVGTDIVRHHAHVTQPDQPDTWFTVGPHSPAQVNVDLAARYIDPHVPLLGKTLNDRAGNRSVIDPTGLSSIVEAARLHTQQPGCYGLPLSAKEARDLTEFMDREMGCPVTVSEGIAPTLPRDAGRNIRWNLLRMAGGIPTFAQRMQAALLEMETGRVNVLDALVKRIAARHPQPAVVDHQWVLNNRDILLMY